MDLMKYVISYRYKIIKKNVQNVPLTKSKGHGNIFVRKKGKKKPAATGIFLRSRKPGTKHIKS